MPRDSLSNHDSGLRRPGEARSIRIGCRSCGAERTLPTDAIPGSRCEVCGDVRWEPVGDVPERLVEDVIALSEHVRNAVVFSGATLRPLRAAWAQAPEGSDLRYELERVLVKAEGVAAIVRILLEDEAVAT